MRLFKVKQKYPNRYAILLPHRKRMQSKVTSWKVLNVAMTLPEAENLLVYYEKQGLCDAVIYDTSESGSDEMAKHNARFFRVYYGTN